MNIKKSVKIVSVILFRSVICSLLLFTAAQWQLLNAADDLQTQLNQRRQQYEQTIQQRVVRFSPEFQVKIHRQVRRTIESGTARLAADKVLGLPNFQETLCRVLPTWRHQQFLAKHKPAPQTPLIEAFYNTIAAVLTKKNSGSSLDVCITGCCFGFQFLQTEHLSTPLFVSTNPNRPLVLRI